MGQKLGGIVCDNVHCRKFVDYADEEGIKNCYIIPLKYKWTYCCEKCAIEGRYYRMEITKK